MISEEAALRIAALDSATRITVSQHGCAHEVLDTAERLYTWLSQPQPVASATLTAGPVSKQSDHPKDGTMQLHDDDQFPLVLDAKDAKGQEVTGDTVTWTVDDETVVTLQVSDDTKTATVVAGNVGSAVITWSDETLSGTYAVDVVPGDVATVELTAGAVTKQDANGSGNPAGSNPAAGAPGDGTAPATSGDAPAASTDSAGVPAQDGTQDTTETDAASPNA